MDDFDRIKQNVLRQLNRCVVCHRAYEEKDISPVQRRPGVWTLMVECEQCHSRNYIAAVTEDGSAEEAALEIRQLTRDAMTEMKKRLKSMAQSGSSAEEEEIPPHGEPVTAADVIDMHDFLKDFDGDFAALFRSRNQ